VQAAGSPGGLAFLLIEEILQVPVGRRTLDPAMVLKRREFLVQPAVDALAVVLARNPIADASNDEAPSQEALEHESVEDLRQALTLCEGLVARLNECASELSGQQEPGLAAMAGAFSGPAADLERTLESVAAAFDQSDVATVASSLSELCVVLGGLVPEQE
jgi:hypothetical protein